MKLEYRLMNATGSSPGDCHFILQRWDPRDEEFSCESFVIQVNDGRISAVIGTLGFYKDIWRSPSSTAFVHGGRSVLWSDNPVQGGGDWHEQNDVTGYGIWGLDDNYVLAYGDPMGRDMFCFNGSSWEQIDAPGFVKDVHGISPDLLYAAGSHGIAKFNGKNWDLVPSSSGRAFTSIHVVSENEMYAILDREQVWKGSVDGWTPMSGKRGYPALTCITKWNDKVWVGDSYSGLSVMEESELKVVKEKLRLQSMVAGETLTVTHSYGISGTENGVNFRGFKVDALVDILGSQKPVWL